MVIGDLGYPAESVTSATDATDGENLFSQQSSLAAAPRLVVAPETHRVHPPKDHDSRRVMSLLPHPQTKATAISKR